MGKIRPFGLSWIDFVCIIVAVIVAEMATDYFKAENIFLEMIIFFIGWFIGFTICYYMIKLIRKWIEKN